MVEYRKLIAFGKSSYVVSLPKQWVEKHKLEKGSVLSMAPGDGELTVYPGPQDPDGAEREVRISVDGKDLSRLNREIISAYLDNYNSFILHGKELTQKAGSIRNVLHNLMAIEVMEQTSDRIIAKDFIDVKSIDMQSLVRKADMIIRSMFNDSKTKSGKAHIDSLVHRDTDVDKLNFLVHRAVRFGLQNPVSLTKRISAIDLMVIYRQMACMERVADDTIRFAHVINGVNSEDYKVLVEIFASIEDSFSSTMKAVYSQDGDLAHKAAKIKKKVYDRCNEILAKEGLDPHFASALQQLKNIARDVHTIGRTVYT